jgi:hypothetical protein
VAHGSNEDRNGTDGSRQSSSSWSRRKFVIATGTVVAGAAILPPQAVFASTNLGANSGLRSLHMRGFARCTGQRFSARHDGKSIALELVSVTDLLSAKDASTHTGECFALRFRHVSGAAPVQGTYTLHNRSLGQFPLFVVPGEQAAGALSCTAIINRQA